MTIYSENDVKTLSKSTRNYLILFFVILGITIATIVPLCFFITDSNKVVITIIFAILLSITFCDLLYFLINIKAKNTDLIRHIEKLLVSDQEEVDFVVKKVDSEITKFRNVKVIPYACVINNKEFILYAPKMEELLEVNCRYKGKITNSFIVEYEKE